MNIKKISAIVAGVALSCGLATTASAVTLTAGDLKITINAYDAGTTNYGNSGTPVCTTVAGCDAVAGINTAPNAIGSEDTWGIFSVQSITSLSTGAIIFHAGDNGEYLTGVFGGIEDTYVEVTGVATPHTTALGTGGKMYIYSNNANYVNLGPNFRIGQFGYQGITDIGGSLALSADFAGGGVFGLPQYTYNSSYLNATISGGGEAFLDITGGSLMSKLDTNKEIDPNGGAHDLFLKVTYGRTNLADLKGFTVDATGDVQASAIPEPASLALFGLGLAGVACLRRRKA